MKRRELLLRTAVFGLLTLLRTQTALADNDKNSQTGGIEINVTRHLRNDYPVFDVQASVLVNASAQRVWQVLTDYDHLAEFVPNLRSSHLISRNDLEGVVAQEGYGQFLFIKQPIHLQMRVQETPFSSIALTLLSGNMHEYQARWQLNTAENGIDNRVENTARKPRTQIVYTGTIAPAFYIPSLFGNALMKNDLRNMIAAVVKEIEKAR